MTTTTTTTKEIDLGRLDRTAASSSLVPPGDRSCARVTPGMRITLYGTREYHDVSRETRVVAHAAGPDAAAVEAWLDGLMPIDRAELASLRVRCDTVRDFPDTKEGQQAWSDHYAVTADWVEEHGGDRSWSDDDFFRTYEYRESATLPYETSFAVGDVARAWLRFRGQVAVLMLPVAKITRQYVTFRRPDGGACRMSVYDFACCNRPKTPEQGVTS